MATNTPKTPKPARKPSITVLRNILMKVQYKPTWTFAVTDGYIWDEDTIGYPYPIVPTPHENPGASRRIELKDIATLIIRYQAPDSYATHTEYAANRDQVFRCQIPPFVPFPKTELEENQRWLNWLFGVICYLEVHEAAEFFRIITDEDEEAADYEFHRVEREDAEEAAKFSRAADAALGTRQNPYRPFEPHRDDQQAADSAAAAYAQVSGIPYHGIPRIV
jgi:hypothetical protein